MYEVAQKKDGKLIRGGIKAPLPVVESWIREYAATDPNSEYIAVPASETALTKEELWTQLDKFTGRYKG